MNSKNKRLISLLVFAVLSIISGIFFYLKIKSDDIKGIIIWGAILSFNASMLPIEIFFMGQGW